MTIANEGNAESADDALDDVLRELDADATNSGLENERIRFFLRHQPLILEWQALADETWAEVKKTLADVTVELEDGRARAAGFEVAARVVGQDRLGPVLYQNDWCIEVAGEPNVGFVIGWDSRPDPSGTWPNSTRPYYGILAGGPSDDLKRLLRQALKPLAEERLKRGDLPTEKFQLGVQWTAYRRLDASATWWENIADWRGRIADNFVKAASAWAGVIDDGVASFRRTPPA